MDYKIKGAFKKSKKAIIVFLVLWIVVSIVLVPPISVSIVESTEKGLFDFNMFVSKILTNIGDMGANFSKIFTPAYINEYWKTDGYCTLLLLFCVIVGILKAMPKNEYTDIEHGSSDWAKGEQYSILNRRKGILLAEHHYLPVDKRGNTNVLVVGRFWIW